MTNFFEGWCGTTTAKEQGLRVDLFCAREEGHWELVEQLENELRQFQLKNLERYERF